MESFSEPHPRRDAKGESGLGGTCPSPVPVMGGQGCLDGRPAGTTEFPRPGDSPSIFNILIVVKSSSRKSYHLTIVKWTFLWH